MFRRTDISYRCKRALSSMVTVMILSSALSAVGVCAGTLDVGAADMQGHHLSSQGAVLTISEGLAIAASESHVMKIAAKNVDISEKETQVAMSVLLPTINAEIAETFQRHKPTVIFSSQRVPMANKESLSYSINIKQILYNYGANLSTYKASTEALESSRADYERIKNLTALEFIVGCYELLEYDKLLSVSRSEIERLDLHLNVARELFKEGAITKNDLLQAEVRLADVKQRLLSLKNLRMISASKLNNLLQRPLMSELTIAEPIDTVDAKFEIEHFLEMAETLRPEVKIIDHELSILTLQQRMKFSEYLPTFYAQGGYNYVENDYQLYEGNWFVVLGAKMNLFSGGSTTSELSKLRLKKDRVTQERKKLLDAIALDIERYFLSMKTASEKLEVVKDSIAQAEENLKINKTRYEHGQGTATDVIDAITLLTSTQTNYYSALYEQRRALAGLLYSSGDNLKETFR